MNNISQRIHDAGIVPVVKIQDAAKAGALAHSLLRGGLDCIEVTFRTATAADSIAAICNDCPEMLVGAGTVLTCEQVNQAAEAGAKFIVTPGFNRKVVEYCLEKGLPVYPGCSDPSAIESGIELGLEILKFFPAEQLGGLKMIRALSGPYQNVLFMPTGGINENNLLEYLSFDRIAAVGGTWMVKEELIENNRFDEITAIARESVRKMLGFRLRHVGINCKDPNEAAKQAALLAKMFDFDVKAGNSSDFAGTAFEFMKKPAFGTCGHICLETNDISRAVAHLAKRGISIDESGQKYDSKGCLHVVNLTDEVCGFGLQLINR